MHQPGKAPFAPYYQLINEIDNLCESLEEKHKQHMNCKKGCDLCCMAISVFPVEFYAIKGELDKQVTGDLPVPENVDDCRFLVGHSCTIYSSRPVICRTHGLPLLYRSLEDDEQFELSCCELNFTKFDLEDFNGENTYPMDRINSQLYMINKNFVADFEGGRFSEQERIPLSDLISFQAGNL